MSLGGKCNWNQRYLWLQWLTLSSVQQGSLHACPRTRPLCHHSGHNPWHSPQHWLCSCSWQGPLLLHLPWGPTLLCRVHLVLWVSLRKCWHGTQPIRSSRFPNTSCVVCTAFCLPICVFSRFIPRCAEIWLPPVKVLCQLPHPPVQGEGDEITPSCASSEINGAKRASFCTRQTSKSLTSY